MIDRLHPRWRPGFWLLALLVGISAGVQAAGLVVTTSRLRAELLSEAAVVAPGRPFWVALRLTLQPGWHTYWRNPGDSGEAPRIRWTLPEGFSAGEIQWLPPQRLPIGPLMNHGYSEEAWLPVLITPPLRLEAGAVTLRATATWLVCKEDCIPERGEFSLTLPVGAAAASAQAPLFGELRNRLPRALPGARWQATDGGLRLLLPDLSLRNLREVWFFAEDYGVLDHAAEQLAKRADGRLVLGSRPASWGCKTARCCAGFWSSSATVLPVRSSRPGPSRRHRVRRRPPCPASPSPWAWP